MLFVIQISLAYTNTPRFSIRTDPRKQLANTSPSRLVLTASQRLAAGRAAKAELVPAPVQRFHLTPQKDEYPK